MIKVAEGMLAREWADRYITSIRTATTPKELAEWAQFNAVPLAKLGDPGDEVDEDERQTRIAIRKEIDGVFASLLNPQKAPVSAPSGLQNWRRDAEGAISGCETKEELDEVDNKIVEPARGKVSPEDWEAIQVALEQAGERIELGK